MTVLLGGDRAAAKEQLRQDLLRRLCALQARIASDAIGYGHCLDCICGVPDDGKPLVMEFWSNSGAAVEFIEQAVAEKLTRITDARDSAETHIRGILAELADAAGVTAEDLARLRGQS